MQVGSLESKVSSTSSATLGLGLRKPTQPAHAYLLYIIKVDPKIVVIVFSCDLASPALLHRQRPRESSIGRAISSLAYLEALSIPT